MVETTTVETALRCSLLITRIRLIRITHALFFHFRRLLLGGNWRIKTSLPRELEVKVNVNGYSSQKHATPLRELACHMG